MGNKHSREWLYSAVEAEDINLITQILKVNPHYLNEPMTNDCKTTPLNRAVWRGSIPVVNFLIERGADVNKSGPKNMTPLMWACVRSHLELVKILSQKGARCDVESEEGLTPIDYAILYQNYEIALYLYKESLDQPKKAPFYREFVKGKNYPYYNYEEMLEHLELKIPVEQCPKFNVKPPTPEEPPLEDPVIDPRESWPQFFNRVMNFDPPPMIERSKLPAELQPQNRLFGKLRSLVNLQNPYPKGDKTPPVRSASAIGPSNEEKDKDSDALEVLNSSAHQPQKNSARSVQLEHSSN